MTSLQQKIIRNAIERFGTPLYLYDGDEITKTYGRLKKLTPSYMDVFYSMKANPLLGICQLLRQEGACCEVSSEAELAFALKAGFHPRNIIFVGPGKSMNALECCVRHGLYAVVCESIDELIRLNHIAQQHQVQCPVLLRINPDFGVKHAPLKMGGKATQFGMDLLLLQTHIKQILKYRHIQIRGIQVYNGTRMLNADSVIDNTIQIIQLARKLSLDWSIPFDCVDIGGGFGIPYFEDETVLDVEKIFDGIDSALQAYQQDFPETRFILECGRYLVGQSGVLISQIVSTKTSHNEAFLITDGGLHCHMAATGLGSFMQRNFPIQLLSRTQSKDELHRYHIAGPLCTPGDVIGKHVLLPKASVGDFVMVSHVGAYGATASPGRFLSHGFPAEVLLNDNKLYLVRRRETVKDMLATQIGLPMD